MAENGSGKLTPGGVGIRKIVPKPQPIEIDIARTAVLVVDMQNDFSSEGGMFDRVGIDRSKIRQAIAPISQVLCIARTFGLPVVYIKMAFRADLSDLGEVGAPNRDRHLLYGVGQPAKSPDGRESRILIRDTWNTDIVSELAPHPGDIMVYKHRFSAFYQTELDAILKQRGVKYLITTGCTTSVCVESTVRDAFFRDYSTIVLSDCTAEPIGPGAEGYQLIAAKDRAGGGSNYDATLLLIETLFGWVSNSEALKTAFETTAHHAGLPASAEENVERGISL